MKPPCFAVNSGSGFITMNETKCYHALSDFLISIRKKTCTLYDWNGKAVYGAEVSGGGNGMMNADCPFLAKVSIDDLNIRKGAGTNTAKTGAYTGKGVFTIMEVREGKGSDKGWGRLKSGVGWISLDYCQKV